MSRLAHHAETLKLARFLDLPPETLAFLEPVPAEALRSLRERLTADFFAGDAPFFKRVVVASRLLPVPMLALVAEKVLGPLLAARISGQMDVERGVGIASRLPTAFLAEVCLRLDPQSARPLIQAIPVAQIVEVAVELTRRDEHVTMGRFVDIVSDEAIRAVIRRMDDTHLLRTAFLAENKTRLDAIVGLLDRERLVAIIRTAASEDDDLWAETLGLMQHLSPAVRGRLTDLAASLETEVLGSMVRAIDAQHLWGEALPLLSDMQPDSRRRFANLPDVQKPAVLVAVMAAASGHGIWGDVLPLVGLMDDASLARTAVAAESLDGEQMLEVARAAAAHDGWPSLLRLIRQMSDTTRVDTVALLGNAPEAALASLVPVAESEKLWPLLHEAWPRMTRGARQRLSGLAEAAGLGDRLPAVE